MKLLQYPDKTDLQKALKRPAPLSRELFSETADILQKVREKGDTALKDLSLKYDGISIDTIRVSREELEEGCRNTPETLKKAIQQAEKNIRTYHEYQREGEFQAFPVKGIRCWQKKIPIDRVGLYIPGGSAPLISTVLMLGIPAGIAGAREIVLTTPPGPSGIIHPAILYSASLLGIERVYRCGGAQAIGAMAYGTESIPAVDKIFGPGNRYVTAAKVLVSQEGTAIDMAAGPSELAVVADDSTRPDFAAADLLSQMEHGPDSQAVLFTTVKTVAEKVIAAMAEQKKTLPRLRLINASEDSSAAVLFRTEEELIDAVNNYAPEHLILQVSNPGTMAGKIRNAGSVFLGQYSPEAAGDYASGPNHTLPTGGSARAFSGLTVSSFEKSISFQELTSRGLASLGQTVMVIAGAEQLEAHKRAVEIRIRAIEQSGSGGETEDFSPADFLRPNLREVKPYQAARHKKTEGIRFFLDGNENPLSSTGSRGNNRYPDPRQLRVKEEVSRTFSVPMNSVFIGNGSDEVIDLVIRAFCEPGKDKIVTCPPTYGMYSTSAASQGVETKEIPLRDDFSLDTGALRNTHGKVLFLCSPNNPTGMVIHENELTLLIDSFPGVVVVDEAYIDFSSARSVLEITGFRRNLIVLRTLSKAWGLAGVRIGLAFGDPGMISILNSIKPPYNVSGPAQRLAVKALSRGYQKDLMVRTIVDNRCFLRKELEKLPVVREVLPSEGNFLLLRLNGAAKIYRDMERLGFALRYWPENPRLKNWIRISVGTREEIILLLEALHDQTSPSLRSAAVPQPRFSSTPQFEKPRRRAEVRRQTTETQILVRVELDRSGRGVIDTGIGFFDHMLTQIASHSGCYMEIIAKGDLEVDEHHTIEDTALSLGEAITQSLGSKKDIGRYGFSLPMDESAAEVLLDFSGRPEFAWNAHFTREQIGGMPAEMFPHFFKSLSTAAGAAIHISCKGENEHHMAEGIFKAFGRALGMAVRQTGIGGGVPSTKGTLRGTG